MNTSLRLLTLALLTSSAVGLTDCKKNSEPEPPKPSQREIWLTTPGWKLDGFAITETTAAGAVTTTNYPLTLFEPCGLDDLDYYHRDKTFTKDEGSNKCSAIFPDFLTSGTWAFASDETVILVVNPKQSKPYPSHIRTLTATAMALVSPADTLPNGTTSVKVRTYVAH